MGEQYKYFSTQRPISIGTYSRKNNVSIKNYNTRQFVKEINAEAWGELIYNTPLTESEMSEYELSQSKDQKKFVDDIKSIEDNIELLQKDLKTVNDGAEIESINNMINAMQDAISEMKKDRIYELSNEGISFYVSECMEFPSMGNNYENIETIEKAIEIYKQLPKESVNMGNGIGVMLDSERELLGGYSGKYSLYEGNKVDTLEFYSEEIKNNDIIKNAINVLKNELIIENAITHREEKRIKEETKTKENKIQEKVETKKLSVKDETIEMLRNGIKETLDSDKFADWCKKQGKLYLNNYSFSNAMLTYLQKPNASYVMGYEAWKTVGRQVNKGAKGIKILAPVLVKEYNKGGLLVSIKKSCMDQFKQDPKLGYANFKLGQTKLSFNMYKNGLFDVKINDAVKMAHITSDQLRKFLNQSVIGKIPAYYNAVTVFDINDTNSEIEYLWVKDGFKKEELATDENGKAITNKKGQFKIINSAERKAKFNVDIDMTLKEADENKMNILYDTLKTISKNNGIPVDEKSKNADENLVSGALGYYRRPTEEYSKGNIVISSDLSITNKVSVLFHEMAHSQMHRDLEKFKEEMSKMNDTDVQITRELKETQAEAVAYMTASNFGIETSHKSFEYIANWSNGRELKELEQSLNLIYKKSKELMKDIEKELDNRGLDLQIEAKENKILSEEDKQKSIKEFKGFVLNENRENQEIQKNALDDLKLINDDDIQKSIVKEQIILTKKIDEKIKELDEKINQFENTNSSKVEIELRNKIQSQIKQIDLLKNKINELSEERINVVKEKKDIKKTDMKTLYANDPVKAIENLKDNYEDIKDINNMQIKFLANSKFISKEYGKFLGVDNKKFVNLANKHLENFEEVMSKNKTVVEITLCEQWGDTPIFKEGALLHPKIANKVLQEAEKQIQSFKKKADAENDYYPYSKCNLSIYSITDKNKLSVLNTRIDIGDNEQKNLVDHLEQICNKSKEKQLLLENFSKSTRERGNTIMIEPVQEEIENNKNDGKARNLSMSKWKRNMGECSNDKQVGELEKNDIKGKERE